MLAIVNFINKIRKKFLFLKIKNFFKRLWSVIYKSIFTFNLHGGIECAGYLSFSLLFAIFPFMIFFTIIIGYFGQTQIGIELIEMLKFGLPDDIIKTLFPVIDNVIYAPKTGVLSIAMLSLIWSASSLVDDLRGIIDRAFRIKTKKSYFWIRLASICKFLVMTILIIVGIFITIIFPKILVFLSEFMPMHYDSNNILIFLKPLLLNLFLFTFILSIYYITPSKQNKLKDVLWGGILTLVGWFFSLKILTFYLQKMAEFQVVYGSLTGIIATLFFFYVMAIILIFGAEFNYNINHEFFNKNKLN